MYYTLRIGYKVNITKRDSSVDDPQGDALRIPAKFLSAARTIYAFTMNDQMFLAPSLDAALSIREYLVAYYSNDIACCECEQFMEKEELTGGEQVRFEILAQYLKQWQTQQPQLAGKIKAYVYTNVGFGAPSTALCQTFWKRSFISMIEFKDYPTWLRDPENAKIFGSCQAKSKSRSEREYRQLNEGPPITVIFGSQYEDNNEELMWSNDNYNCYHFELEENFLPNLPGLEYYQDDRVGIQFNEIVAIMHKFVEKCKDEKVLDCYENVISEQLHGGYMDITQQFFKNKRGEHQLPQIEMGMKKYFNETLQRWKEEKKDDQLMKDQIEQALKITWNQDKYEQTFAKANSGLRQEIQKSDAAIFGRKFMTVYNQILGNRSNVDEMEYGDMDGPSVIIKGDPGTQEIDMEGESSDSNPQMSSESGLADDQVPAQLPNKKGSPPPNPNPPIPNNPGLHEPIQLPDNQPSAAPNANPPMSNQPPSQQVSSPQAPQPQAAVQLGDNQPQQAPQPQAQQDQKMPDKQLPQPQGSQVSQPQGSADEDQEMCQKSGSQDLEAPDVLTKDKLDKDKIFSEYNFKFFINIPKDVPPLTPTYVNKWDEKNARWRVKDVNGQNIHPNNRHIGEMKKFPQYVLVEAKDGSEKYLFSLLSGCMYFFL